MAESNVHMEYVNLVLNYAKEIIPEDLHALIYTDRPDSVEKPPRTSQNFTPDLYFCSSGLMVIGEAKTAPDVDRKHSISQYTNYYEDASLFNGNAIVIICVPWQMKCTVKNIIRRIKRQFEKNVTVYVISELEGVDVI